MVIRRVSGGTGPIDTEHDKSMRKAHPELQELWKLRNEAAGLAERLCTRYSRIVHFRLSFGKRNRLFDKACDRRERRERMYKTTLKLLWVKPKPTPPPTRKLRWF